MVDRLEIADVESGARRVVDVPDGTAYLTISSAGEVLLRGDEVGAVLRLVPTKDGHRLESTTPGGRVVVGGEELFCKDLCLGDAFELGGYRLRWLGAPGHGQMPTAPSVRAGRSRDRSAATAGEATTAARSVQRRSRSPSRRTLWPVLTMLTLSLAAIAVALRVCVRTDWPRTPQHYVDLARTQFAGARCDEALATLDFALREATGATRTEAEALHREIERALVAAADVVVVQKARADTDLLHGFHDRYLAADRARPAAREFVRLCDVWLQQHDARLRTADGGPLLLAEVHGLRNGAIDLADLASPDTAADVLFAARSHLRFQVREYKAALARLDAFLAQHAGDPTVQAERTAMLADGQQWIGDRVAMLQRMLQRGERERAATELRALERHALLREWDDLLAPVRDQLR